MAIGEGWPGADKVIIQPPGNVVDDSVAWWEWADVVYVCAEHFGVRRGPLDPLIAARLHQVAVGTRIIITTREIPPQSEDEGTCGTCAHHMVLTWQEELKYTWGTAVTRIYVQTESKPR